jgi:hypothetical protein
VRIRSVLFLSTIFEGSLDAMAGSIKSISKAVVVVGVVLWALDVLGLCHSLSRIRVG